MGIGTLPSPLLLLFLLLLIHPAQANDDYFRNGLGQLGHHYNLKKGYPYVQCESWEFNSTKPAVDCGPSGSDFFGKRLGCNGVFRVKNPTKYDGIKKDEEVILEPGEYEHLSGGCWHGSDAVHNQCYRENECVATVRIPDRFAGVAFCCCRTHECNKRIIVRVIPAPENSTTLPDNAKFVTGGDSPTKLDELVNSTRARQASVASAAAAAAQSSERPSTWFINDIPYPLVILIAVLSALFIFCIMCGCYLGKSGIAGRWRSKDRKKVFDVQKEPKEDALPLVVVEPTKPRVTIKESHLVLGEKVAEGKTAIVFKGTFKHPKIGVDETIAVKMLKDQKSFLLEESVYRLCESFHPHLVHYIGSNHDEKRPFIVTNYHERGCLENYLKESSFTPMEALSFLTSFMNGLTFLHTPSVLPNGGGNKAAIVHRDIKSRNILVKSDGTAAIADFGLAMICEGNRPYGRHYQVGTHRYMSPELLVGMATMNMDGLKMADVYAASLIIWEILNRTKADEEDEMEEAQLPYTVEIEEKIAEELEEFSKRHGSSEGYSKKPIQYYLSAIVHGKNERPVMRQRLKDNQITNELVKTTLDMWDFEVDGRISSACAHARLCLLQKDAANGTIPQPIS